MTMTGCPELRRLASLLNNRVLAAERTELEDHVESCGDCQQALDALTDAIDWGLGPSHGGSMAMQEMEAAAAGDGQSAAQLLPLVYAELRKLAAARMAAEKPGHTLNPTALVHEAYLRLVGNQRFGSRGHFFAAAAEAMRRILVNHARDRNRLKRAGGRVRLELLDHPDSLPLDPDLVLSIDELLTALGQEDTAATQVAHLHLFGGLSIEKAGETLGLSRAVAYRNWTYARAWLRAALEK